MHTRIQKWGNSLALRIPKAFADETGLNTGSPVEIKVVDGKIVIVPVHKATYQLDNLLSGITDENRHGSIDTGDPTGNESW